MYNVISKDSLMSKACIHYGTHNHPVAKEECRETIAQIKNEIMMQVEKNPNVKASTIGIAVGRELLMKGLIDDNEDAKILSSSDLDLVLRSGRG